MKNKVEKLKISLELEEKTVNLLKRFAGKKHQSVQRVIEKMIREQLEDYYLSKLAEEMDQPGEKRYSHEEAWK